MWHKGVAETPTFSWRERDFSAFPRHLNASYCPLHLHFVPSASKGSFLHVREVHIVGSSIRAATLLVIIFVHVNFKSFEVLLVALLPVPPVQQSYLDYLSRRRCEPPANMACCMPLSEGS